MAGPDLAHSPSSPSLRCPNLPPHQLFHDQVQFGGEICLARGRGLWMSPHHKQATSRQRWQVPADERSQPAADLVPDHRGPDRPSYHEPSPGRFILVISTHQQVPGQYLPPNVAAVPDGYREIIPSPHPGLCGKHA